jgi:drug/metabolite transporter superfamily protein YnfA
MEEKKPLENEQSKSLKNWLELIAIVLSLFLTVFGILNQIKTDTNTMRYIAVSGYIVFLSVVIWIGWIDKKVHLFVRMAGRVLFFVISPLFILWVGTWIVKAPIDLNSHPIEREAYTIYDYMGQGNPQGTGAEYLAVSNTFELNRTITKFSFDYTIPQKDSYAGFVIHFDPVVNITDFQNINLVIKFKDNSTRLKMTLRDAAKNSSWIILGDGPFGDAANNQEQIIVIPLDSFPNVVHSLLQEIEFSVDGSFVTSTNNVVVGKVRFTK